MNRPYSSRPEPGLSSPHPSAYVPAYRPSSISKSETFAIDESMDNLPSSPHLSRSSTWRERATATMLHPKTFLVVIFVTAIYSTLFSTMWFLIAVIRPHWGSLISSNGPLQPSVASILVAGIAKTIEMSFSTVMMVCLGQYLTNKAKETGITLVDLQLKSMILLPMALVTQKGGVRALLRSGLLGFICVTAYTAAALYTTASDAVGMCRKWAVSPMLRLPVSPRLDNGHPAVTNLSAFFQSSIANDYYMSQSCPNPPKSVLDANTCITAEHAGSSLRNFLQYLSNWQTVTGQNKLVEESSKPAPMAIFGDNIAVEGQWLYTTNYTAISTANKRLVTGTQMALPFAGVINATTIPSNNLGITDELGGELKISAMAVTPVVGVMCAVVTAEELVPIVYSNWSRPANTSLGPQDFQDTLKNQTWRTNATVFDDLFQFNNSTRDRPVFYSLPSIYNSEFDGEGTYRDMLYVLFNSNVSKSATDDASQYTLCGMNFTLMGGCSTIYEANSSGTTLRLNCKEHNEMAFDPKKITLGSSPKDWVNVASLWGQSIGLGGGIYDANDATVVMLTQLAPTDSSFDPKDPSLADSLAILSAATVLQSTIDAPFDGHWPFHQIYKNNIIPTANIQKFQAKVQITDYSSGTHGDRKSMFVIELLLVVLFNIGGLAYISIIVFGRLSIGRHGIKRVRPKEIQDDITELREVFTAAIHSPTIRIINTPRTSNNVHWKYQNGVFRPSRLAHHDRYYVQ